jgi:hypothetical protein
MSREILSSRSTRNSIRKRVWAAPAILGYRSISPSKIVGNCSVSFCGFSPDSPPYLELHVDKTDLNGPGPVLVSWTVRKATDATLRVNNNVIWTLNPAEGGYPQVWTRYLSIGLPAWTGLEGQTMLPSTYPVSRQSTLLTVRPRPE